MSGLWDSLTGSGESTVNVSNTTPGPSPEEQELIRLNTQLAQKQLDNIDQLQPFQQELLKSSMADLQRQNALNSAFDSAVSPADQAAAMKAEFDRAQKMGPVQDELLQMQLEQLRNGGAATPEQQQRIKEATDAAIGAGNSDIDASTKRGIGLISDELANSRGLRLSDSPMSSEAALLSREGVVQKGSLEKNLRAAQASSVLNYPLAVQGLQSGINLAQQNLGTAAQQFQAQLRQQAAQNRMSLFGNTASSGLGLASVGNGAGASALSSLSGVRSNNKFTNGTMWDPNATMNAWSNWKSSDAKLMGGIGGMMSSDRRLKTDIERIGELPSGIPVYRFRYNADSTVRVGVMADEVEPIIPEAVTKDERGYYFVDYSKLR